MKAAYYPGERPFLVTLYYRGRRRSNPGQMVVYAYSAAEACADAKKRSRGDVREVSAHE